MCLGIKFGQYPPLYIYSPFSMQYAAMDPALLATYAAAERYQLVTSQPLAAAGMPGMPLGAARYAVPAMAGAGMTYAAAGYVSLVLCLHYWSGYGLHITSSSMLWVQTPPGV